MYTIECLPVGTYQANCYMLIDRNECLVIDPGAEAEVLLNALRGLTVTAIVATHCHSDHIGAINEIAQATGAPVMAGTQDVSAMADPHLSGFDEEGSDYRVETVDVSLVDGQEVRWGTHRLTVLETPGHTPGSICLLDADNKALFTGDTLFELGAGSTEFLRGDAQAMKKTMARLGKLSPEIRVLPGHGSSTTIARELRTNFLLRGGE